jgi:hypothetical protein
MEINNNEIKTRKCSVCCEIKPLTEFGKNRAMKDGHRYDCFECRRSGRVRVKVEEIIPDGFKKCFCCKEVKQYNEFHSDNSKKDKFASYCKMCANNKCSTRRRKKYPPKIKEILPEGFKRCSRCKNIKSKKEFYKNKNQPDGFGYHCKKCKEDNFDKENRRKYIKKWTKKYNDKNPHKMAWRNLLKHTLERLGQPKEGKTIDLLGYSAINLRDYITALLTDGMSWDNYGEWHIDHIKPVSLFPKDTHPNIVNNLNNLQPLWATTREINGIIYEGNYNKGNKYVEKGLLS